jgi:pimeloyl-ACP methyl ester carboxylesterase
VIDLIIVFVTAVLVLNFFKLKQHPPRGLRPNCLLTRHPVLFVHGIKNIFIFFDYWNGITLYLRNHGYDIREPKLAWRGPAVRRMARLKAEIQKASSITGQVHLIGHSLGALDILDLVCTDPEVAKLTNSITLVTAPLSGTPWARLALPTALSDLRYRFGKEGVEKRGRYHIPASVRAGVVTASSPHFLAGAPILLGHRLALRIWRSKDFGENDGLVPLHSQHKMGNYEFQRFWHFPGDHAQVVGAGPKPVDGKTAHECFLDHCISLAELDLVSSK